MARVRNDQPKAKRRSPISREEGERRLKDAARKLSTERPFTEVGVREIAALADVNHGFVHTWFGSKNHLLVAVLRDVLYELAARTETIPDDDLAIRPFDDDVQFALRLAMFLGLEGVDFGDLFDDPIVINAMSKRIARVNNLTDDQARIAAQQAAAIALGAVLFGPFIGVKSNHDVTAVLDQWRDMIRLLAQHGQP
jgi:AcrR family transcriptional regulator